MQFFPVCSICRNVNIHIYEKKNVGRETRRTHKIVKRIACFDQETAKDTIHLLYFEGNHYDALLFNDNENIDEEVDVVEEKMDDNDAMDILDEAENVQFESGEGCADSNSDTVHIPTKTELFQNMAMIYDILRLVGARKKKLKGRFAKDETCRIIAANEILRNLYRGKLPIKEDMHALFLPPFHETMTVIVNNKEKKVKKISLTEQHFMHDWCKKIHPDPRSKSKIEMSRQKSILEYLIQHPPQGKRCVLLIYISPSQAQFFHNHCRCILLAMQALGLLVRTDFSKGLLLVEAAWIYSQA